MSQHNALGKIGEDITCDFLKKKGYTILSRNFRYGRAEIDIVAKHHQIIVFVEVKTRKNLAFGWGDESIDTSKIANLCLAAEEFLRHYPDSESRYDIVLVHFEKGTNIRHIQDAFWPGVF